MLLDLLPSKTYFRFNPRMPEPFNLDETRPAKWKAMQYETNMYMRRNDYKVRMAAAQLLAAKSPTQVVGNFLRQHISL